MSAPDPAPDFASASAPELASASAPEPASAHAPASASAPEPDPTLPILIHDDPIFGLHAHTTPGQTVTITHAFKDTDLDINIDEARRLRRDAHDLVIFRFETLEDLFDEVRGHLNLQPASDDASAADDPDDASVDAPTDTPTAAPADVPTDASTDASTAASTAAPADASTDAPTDAPTDASAAPASAAPAPAFHYPPNLVRLIILGDPEHDASQMPPDFYRQRGITPADIPALQRLFSDPEIIYMQDHGGYHTACWARSNALRALVELRAPGVAQLMLDDMRATEIAYGEDSFMEPNIEDDEALLPMLDPDACAPVITELQTHAHALPGHATRMTEILSKLAKRHPHLRDTCRDAICQQLENHPVNDREYNGFLVAALIDLEATEAAPLIEQAYAAGHVDDTICGDWEDVQVSLGLKDSLPAYIPAWMSKKRLPGDEYDDDAEIYDDGDDEYDGDDDDDDADFIPFSDSSETPIRRAAPKIGRNDPCPCGSGKKYKKCCMDKNA